MPRQNALHRGGIYEKVQKTKVAIEKMITVFCESCLVWFQSVSVVNQCNRCWRNAHEPKIGRKESRRTMQAVIGEETKERARERWLDELSN